MVLFNYLQGFHPPRLHMALLPFAVTCAAYLLDRADRPRLSVASLWGFAVLELALGLSAPAVSQT
ncbi:MAG: hypothetical protein GY791_14855 [Alphaproteobacteria bacterium]|nr:hypothetical protein [Alphaproteobacteria bacterium]